MLAFLKRIIVRKCIFFSGHLFTYLVKMTEKPEVCRDCSLTGRYCEPWQDIKRGERVSPVESR